MFNNSKYTKWYTNIVDTAASRIKPDGYCEHHHKIPKSIGGSNRKDNLVWLTAREHLLCHLLLAKMMVLDDHKLKMTRALAAMLAKNKHHDRGRITSHTYATIRKAASTSSALRAPSNRFDPSKASEEYRAKMSASLKGREVPWRKGAKDSEETRRKKSQSGKNKVFTPEHRANLKLSALRRREREREERALA